MAEPARAKKNPLLRTRLPLLPPSARSRSAHLLTAAAAIGRFDLPACTACGTFLWPMHEACPKCLGDVALRPARQGAVLLAVTQAEVPAHNYFRERAPWHVGLVKMDCGPVALAHVGPTLTSGSRLRLSLVLDRAGQAVLHAAPEQENSMGDDPQWQDMVADPKGRRILITDARHIAALPLAKALAAAGAAGIVAGVPEDWKPLAGQAALAAVPGLTLIPFDVTSDRSVEDAARQIAGKIEILINTSDHLRSSGIHAPSAAADSRAMMETVSFGLMRLARVFGPALSARCADGPRGAAAWVNVLSVFARVHPPALAGYAAAHAAALAFSHALRADLAKGGIRLMTVLTGPTEDEWFQAFPPPRVTGRQLADAIVHGLQRGLEEVVVGDVAQDLLARLAENPKALERELADGRL